MPADAYETAARRCADKNYRLCTIRTTQAHATAATPTVVDVDRFRQMSPLDVARLYIAGRLGRDITERETDMINLLLTQIDEEEHT